MDRNEDHARDQVYGLEGRRALLGAARSYGFALAALVAAVLLRMLLDPILGDTVPFVTLFGAVAAAVWAGGHRPALGVVVLGYLVSLYLFVEPRGASGVVDVRNLVALLAYLVTCFIIIGFGQAMRVSQRRFDELLRNRDPSWLPTTVESIRRTHSLRDVAAIGFALTLLVLILGAVVGPLSVRRLAENERRVIDSHATIGALEALHATLGDAVAGQRGYLLTGEEKYLQPYQEALGRASTLVARLEQLTSDDPDQRARLAELKPNIAQKLAGLERRVSLTTRGERAAALRDFRSGEGDALMHDVRQAVAVMRRAEEALLQRHAQESEARSAAALLSIVVPSIAGVVLLALVFRLTQRNLAVRQRAAEVLAEQRERLRVTLASIGDAVITTDADGRLTYLNGVAESLTGWTQREAEGRPLDQVFHIVNEQTREPAPNPAARALSEGVVVGLANHTVLVRKDGAELPIDDSAAPIRGEAGELLGCVLVFRDIRERRRAEQSLRESESRLAGIIASATDAILTIDAEQKILLFNGGAETVFGYDAQEVVGQPLDRLIPARFREVHRRHVDEFGATGIGMRAMGGERILAGLRRNGEEFPMEARISQNQIGQQKLYTVILRDITARQRAEAEREELLASEHSAREAAEAASRAKDAFLATVSHELRTPLSPILTWARMLQEGTPGPERIASGLQVIERCARSLAQLIEDLVDVARIVAGKMRLEVRPVMVASVVEKAVEIVRPAADAKKVRVGMVLDTEVDAVLGDAERLQQVVWNLLSNAVKFTPKGGRIQVALERVNSHIELAVSDTGQGIDPMFLPYIFERFQQAEMGSSRTHGGLGLGLSIVRHIVEAHGGTVHAESPGPDKGAVFTVKLPLMIARTAGEVERRHPTASLREVGIELPRLDGLRILIVDDEPDANDAVGALLGSCGAEVRAALSAERARHVLAAWKPDVLVSDVGMPGEDGYALISSVRAKEGDASRIPAVALTAYASREDKVRLLSAGFQAHVAKPLEAGELVAVIASLVRDPGRD